MSDPAARERMTAARSAYLPRTLAALLVSGALGPILFMAVDLLWAVAIGGKHLSLSSSDPLNEALGLLGLVLILGCPAAIVSAFLVGLPCIYLARWLRLTSSWTYALGGVGLALGCTAWFARGDVKDLAEWTPFAVTMAVAGAFCGFICWWIAEYPLAAAKQGSKLSKSEQIKERL